jgi:hypothetical protein
VIVLDHNITREQAVILTRWRVRFQRIGVEIGLPSWDDQQEILRFLHSSKQVTFFTRDSDFFRYRLRHANYCLTMIEMDESETASAIRRFLRHPAFKAKAQRCGKVIKLLPQTVIWWEVGKPGRQKLIW